MPLFFQHSINNDTALAVWKIEEEETFFTAYVPLHRAITHPHKRLQHLAGRYLLQYLFPQFPISLIQIADTRKPFLADELFHFSISHCGDYAAAIVSKNQRVGVDIEMITPKIERIAHKFVTDEEWAILQNANGDDALTKQQQLTLVWSCKEALFKWYGRGEVDFKQHMHLCAIQQSAHHVFKNTMLFKKDEDLPAGLHTYFFDDVCLSFVAT